MRTLATIKRRNKDMGIIADDLLALRAAFMQAAQWADVVISTGGVSVGDAITQNNIGRIGSN